MRTTKKQSDTGMTLVPPWSLPTNESFFDSKIAEHTWPDYVLNDPNFKTQIKEHQLLVTLWRSASSDLISPSSEISEMKLTELYKALTQYLGRDPYNQRIILYLPFVLTKPIWNQGTDPQLLQANAEFRFAYRKAFISQLHRLDVRANFVDGNVLEQELRNGQDHTRVIKVMHLVPGLIQSGFFTWNDVISIVEQNSDPMVISGLLDACKVMRAKEILNDDGLQQLRNSSNSQLRDVYNTLQRGLVKKFTPPHQLQTIAEILVALQFDCAEAATINPANSTPNRTAWLRKQAIQTAINTAANQLQSNLQSGETLLHPHVLQTYQLLACIDGLRLASLADPACFVRHQEWFQAMAQLAAVQPIQDAVTKLLSHLHHVGQIDAWFLAAHQVRKRKLQGPFSENLTYFEPSVSEFESMIYSMGQDRFLRARMYPAAIMLGSQLKGYGLSDADADVAVFVKPGVTKGDELEIATRLQQAFEHPRIDGSILVFWLDNDEHGQLVIRENTQTTDAPTLPTWTHILMGGAWVGNDSTLEELRKQLLFAYCYNPGTTTDGFSTRYRWLEELERDVILYRLLHKGYERFYPVETPFELEYDDAIDGRSALYDPHFRFIATELYLTHVFLPNLGKAPK